MRTFDYKFIGDNGQAVFVRAKSRQEAIKECSNLAGIPEDYIKAHFKIKKVWSNLK